MQKQPKRLTMNVPTGRSGHQRAAADCAKYRTTPPIPAPTKMQATTFNSL